MTLFADEIVYETDTRNVHAIGNVSLQQPDLQIYADRAVLNGQTKLGTFYTASGIASVGPQAVERSVFGTMEPDVMFHGAEIAKTGPKTYRIRDGGFTSCVQPTPRWQMSSSNATITLDEHALLRNVVLKVKDVPLLYLPAIYYPINKEDRATGFLLPTYGSSSIRGTSLSNAFFLVLGRSQDATFYHDWFTQTGQGVGADYRFVASPTSRGQLEFYMTNERALLAADGVTVEQAAHRSYSIDGDASHALPHGFRAYGRVNYFTDASTRQVYQNINDFSQRQRAFSGTLTGNLGRYRLTASADQRDIFYGADRGQRTGRAPSFSISASERPIASSKIYVGASGEAAYLVRQDDIARPETNRSLWRFDGGPTIRAPLSTLPFLTATGSASWRLTRWQETYDPVTGEQQPIALNRQLLEMQARAVGPVLSRVFLTPDNGYATGFKHLIEPSLTLRRTTPFEDFDRVVKLDSADYLVGGVTTLDYAITNRLLAKRPRPGATPGSPAAQGIAREILSVEMGQTYYTDPLAASIDRDYESNGGMPNRSTGTFSPLRIRATARPTDGASTTFSMEIDSKHRAIRTMRAAGSLEGERVQVTAQWSKRLMIEDLPGFDRPGDQYLGGTTTVRTAGNRLGGSYFFNIDVANRGFVQQRIVAYYNSQCCGVSFDWQSISTPLYRRHPSDRRFGVSFTLAGIGSFSNPLGSFGGR
jgi:LPS-assembly protein